MKINLIGIILFLPLFIFHHLNVSGQKKNIDTATFYKWPELTSPSISPNGKYLSYLIKGIPNGKNTIVIKSRNEKWKREFICNNDDSFLSLDNDKAVFKNGKDSVVIVTLGKSVEYLSGYENFKVASSYKNSICIRKSDELLLIQDSKKQHYFKIIESHYVLNDHYLLLHYHDSSNVKYKDRLTLVDLNDYKETELWSGNRVLELTCNTQKNIIAFLTNDSATGNQSNVFILNLKTKEKFSVKNTLSSNLSIKRILAFTGNSKNVIISMENAIEPNISSNKQRMRIWSYLDEKIQSEQEKDNEPKEILASISTDNKELVILEEPRDDWNVFHEPNEWGDTWLVSKTIGDCTTREWWNPACKRDWFIVNLRNGSRKRILPFDKTNNNYLLSPNEKNIVYYDEDKRSYFNYLIEKDSIIELTPGAYSNNFQREKFDTGTYLPSIGPRGFVTWSPDGKSIYLYDSFDIWRIDLNNITPPLNITNGFGRKNGIIFSFIAQHDWPIDKNGEFIITGLNTNTKDNGFYKTKFNGIIQNPVVLTAGPYIYYLPFYNVYNYRGLKPIKAEKSDVYIIQRESSHEFPNYYTTVDFKNFHKFTDLAPEKEYNWITSELISWNLPDGKLVQGVLYKPENFDSTKKYPVVFNIYESLSNCLNAYVRPGPLTGGCTLNTPLFVSNGYLVLKPDIPFKLDKSGESALLTTESAIKHLSNYHWVDTARIGVQGCSFGGYETNFIVTHSKMFKAACSGSAVSDLFSYYSGEYENTYTSFTYGQYRMSKNIWENPNAFLLSSPIYKADSLITPLLLFHTSKDDGVAFTQGIQFYLILRKLRKKVWLLEYSQGNHGVFNPVDATDFGLRMLQFFNYYLMETPFPSWMDSRNSLLHEQTFTVKSK